MTLRNHPSTLPVCRLSAVSPAADRQMDDQLDDCWVGFGVKPGFVAVFGSAGPGEPGAGFAGSPVAAAAAADWRSRTAERSSWSFFCSSTVRGGVSRETGARYGMGRGASEGRCGESAGRPPAAVGTRSIAPLVMQAASGRAVSMRVRIDTTGRRPWERSCDGRQIAMSDTLYQSTN